MSSIPAPTKARGWYTFATSLRLAVDSIRAHKLRSFLTLLGVIIGVASVILVGSAIEGLGVYAEQSTARIFGSDTFLIAQIASAGRLSRREIFEKLKKNKRMRKEDVAYLRDSTGNQILYSPYRQKVEDVKYGSLIEEAASIIGASATLPEIREVNVVEGRFFTEGEEQRKEYVAIIGEGIRAKFFSGQSSLGKMIKISGSDFRVIGVQEKLGSAFGRDQDNGVYIPFTVYGRLWGGGDSFALFGKARSGSGLSMEDALDVTRVALRSHYKARPGAPDNFDTLTPDAIRGFIDSILGVISAVVVPVTAISLVVGGIVIMNIMLVSVTERTREIGIRKSLGAKTSDIRLQFLLEAVMLAGFGGLFGLVLGAALTELLSVLFELTLQVTLPYVLLALFVSSTVGIVSGWYPASRAAKLDPIVALRQE